MNKLLQRGKKRKGDDREWHSAVLLCCAWRDLGWGRHVNVTSQLILSHFQSFLQALDTQARFSTLPKSCRGSASVDLRQNLNDLSVKPQKLSRLMWISAIWIMWVKRVTVSSWASQPNIFQVKCQCFPSPRSPLQFKCNLGPQTGDVCQIFVDLDADFIFFLLVWNKLSIFLQKFHSFFPLVEASKSKRNCVQASSGNSI